MSPNHKPLIDILSYFLGTSCVELAVNITSKLDKTEHVLLNQAWSLRKIQWITESSEDNQKKSRPIQLCHVNEHAVGGIKILHEGILIFATNLWYVEILFYG